MPDHTNPDGSLLTPEAESHVPATAGALLKAARQAAGVHLAVLSVNLKVPVRQLEALEADQYPADQSPVFARALASSVCRQLRIDPAPILALMPMSSNHLEPSGRVRYAYAAPADLGRVHRSSRALPAKAKWAAVGMLLLIATLIWMPNPSQWAWFEALSAAVINAGPAPEKQPDTSTAVTEVIAPGMQVMSESSTLPAGSAEPGATPVAAPGTSALPGASLATVALMAQPTVVTPEPNKAAVPAAAPRAELVFNARNTSWVEVKDSKNQLLWTGVLNAGDTKRLEASQAVSVVLGRADAVQVSFKGQPVDLQPHTQVNVARFEVKP